MDPYREWPKHPACVPAPGCLFHQTTDPYPFARSKQKWFQLAIGSNASPEQLVRKYQARYEPAKGSEGAGGGGGSAPGNVVIPVSMGHACMCWEVSAHAILLAFPCTKPLRPVG